MYHLLYYKLKHSLMSVKFLSLIIVLSITASLFCINVMLGYAENLYRSSYDASWYSTICITGDNMNEYREISKFIEENHHFEIGSSLKFSQIDDTIVIGWSGSDPPTRWFPEMGGRFFTEDELVQSYNIAYLSKSLYESNLQESHIIFNDIQYEVVGYGWVIGHNFKRAIGSQSNQTIIDESNTNNMYMIIPCLTYEQQGYDTDMVLIHINDITYQQLDELTSALQNQFPNIEFTQSDNNSSEMRTSEKLRYVPFGIVLALIIGISLIQILALWFDETRSIVYAYTICGISRKKMILIMLSEVLVFILIGEALALLIQRLLLPFLTYMGISYMPNIIDISITMLVAFVLLAFTMLKQMTENVHADRSVM